MTTEIRDRNQELKETLERLRANPRVIKIRVAAPEDCVVGRAVQGVYDKDDVPELPLKGCSRPEGCICRYEPVLDDVYP